ncbi:uncharacterized protein (UPF0276 family) [Spirosoma lacussanchae]|uniref:multinuclear nonheme iron-dependent oxidase n=1 Tax=Spirosoma lacussanchae TaxID=1884249 RepID=UPI001109E4DF|nr:DUF692 family multinuclear iron-containing protein [Spirosoma lacussanchae]
MIDIRSSIACNLDSHILRAALPLFADEKVGAIEWSFDALINQRSMPDWFGELLRTYSEAGCLVGHGVFYSLFSGRWTGAQQQWLDQLRSLSRTYRFDHVTEHFGFMTGADFHKGAPMSIPFTESTLAIGRDRLVRLQDACRCPVGLENLAFAYTIDEVNRHGAFLSQLIEPVNGFIILDLHNLYCQSRNFGVEPDALLSLYPLYRVREIHLSGGSWAPSAVEPGRTIRRDTHDDAVPADVFRLLKQAIDLCPNLRYVVLEQLGAGLQTDGQQSQFQQDFLWMDHIVQTANQIRNSLINHSFLPRRFHVPDSSPLEDPLLYAQQLELSDILETSVSCAQAQQRLAGSGLARSNWAVETWQPAMLETALAIAQKWKNGFD